MHQVKGGVDVFEWHRMGYERRQLDIAAHRILHHPGKLGAFLHTAERLRQFELFGIGINGEDPSGFRLPRALDYGQTDTVKPEDRD